MVSLVLASGSPARRTTLRAAGVDPEVIVSGVDEDAILQAFTDETGRPASADVPLILARAKAEQVAAQLVDAGHAANVVLGCDSVLQFEGEVYGKPGDPHTAITRWHRMRGRSGVLHTGHWLVDQRDPAVARAVGGTASTTVHFADLTDEEIRTYVDTGEPLQVAGAFTVDGLGGPYVTRIEGDHHAVVGGEPAAAAGSAGRAGGCVAHVARPRMTFGAPPLRAHPRVLLEAAEQEFGAADVVEWCGRLIREQERVDDPDLGWLGGNEEWPALLAQGLGDAGTALRVGGQRPLLRAGGAARRALEGQRDGLQGGAAPPAR